MNISSYVFYIATFVPIRQFMKPFSDKRSTLFPTIYMWWSFLCLSTLQRKWQNLLKINDEELFVITFKTDQYIGKKLNLYHIGPNKLKPEYSFEMLVSAHEADKNHFLQLKLESMNIEDQTYTWSNSLYILFDYFRIGRRLYANVIRNHIRIFTVTKKFINGTQSTQNHNKTYIIN